MVKVIRAKMNQITNTALAELFADNKEEVQAIQDPSAIYGWPSKYKIEAGTHVTVATGLEGYFDSDGGINWVKSGSGGDIGPDNPTPYVDLDGDGVTDTTPTDDDVQDYIDDMWKDNNSNP